MAKKRQEPKWGFHGLGEIVYLRTYSRFLPELGRSEIWPETVERVVHGAQAIGARLTPAEEAQLYDHTYNLRGSVSGRALWQLGTPMVEKTGMDSLVNCWATNITSADDFVWIMNRLTVGGGVGFSIEREIVYDLPKVKGAKVEHQNTNDADFIVPDSREGWGELLRRAIEAHFTGQDFTYSTVLVRPAGAPLKTFGGTASGPIALIDGISDISGVLNARSGNKLRSVDVLDICNIIGRVVVAGSARRSAQIALGDVDDLRFLKAKNWASGKIPAWRANSNNTLVANHFDDIPAEYWASGFDGGGEAYGLFNRRLARTVGRLGERRNDPSIVATNPCFASDTRILTTAGWRTFAQLAGMTPTVIQDARVDGYLDSDGLERWNVSADDRGVVANEAYGVRVTARSQQLYRLTTSDGRSVRATSDHHFATPAGMMELSDLRPGDTILVALPEPYAPDRSSKTYNQGLADGFARTTDNLDWLHNQDKDYKAGYLTMLFSRAQPILMSEQRNMVPAEMVDLTLRGGRERLANIQLILQELGVLAEITGDGADTIIGVGREQLARIHTMIGDSIPNVEAVTVPASNEELVGNQAYTTVVSIEPAGVEDVWCLAEDVRRTLVAEGLTARRCGEIGLANREACNLATIFLPNVRSYEEFSEISRLLYRIQKATALLPHPDPTSEAIIHRNMRLGQSVTGVLQATEKQRSWLSPGYEALRAYDTEWSKELGVRESVKLTTCQPSGTMSLMPGHTPGIHGAYARHYIRRVRFGEHDPLVQACRDKGYPVRYDIGLDGREDHSRFVVEFPAEAPEHTPLASEMSAVEQLNWLTWMQRSWADNQVSVTVVYQDHEVPEIKSWLAEHYDREVKSVSFLRYQDHGFALAPYEPISEEEYNRRVVKVHGTNSSIEMLGTSEVDDAECETGACPVR